MMLLKIAMRLIYLSGLVCLLNDRSGYSEDRHADACEIGSHRQTFIDDRMIDMSHGVERTMNPPRRDGVELITADQPWERGGYIGAYSSVVHDQGKVRVWYDLILPTGDGPYDHQRCVCYAESVDGIHFEKPLLNLHEFAGSKANNVVMPGVIGGGSVLVEFLDDRHQPIEGYTLSDGEAVNGNSVRMPVRWKHGSDVGSLADRAVRLRFTMRDCRLYAFQFQDSRGTRSDPGKE